VSSFGQRLVASFAERGQLCVGIDPSSSQLNSWSLPDSASGAREFSLEILEKAAGLVGIVKPQVAFFEQYGSEGFRVLEEVLLRARALGFLVIADAKRGDIGSTMNGYAKAWLSKDAIFQADALTVSPYLGVESLSETAALAQGADKGLFILAATSNSEARTIQTAKLGNSTVADTVINFTSAVNKAAMGSVGAVIGATVSLEDSGIDANLLRNTPILMPGFGLQGVQLSAAGERFGQLRAGLICNVSRSVAGDTREGVSDRIKKACEELRLGLNS
jgi:orotidine-5'-phosphate decarboxylase